LEASSDWRSSNQHVLLINRLVEVLLMTLVVFKRGFTVLSNKQYKISVVVEHELYFASARVGVDVGVIFDDVTG
jgi:hypothetical protein